MEVKKALVPIELEMRSFEDAPLRKLPPFAFKRVTLIL